MRFKLLNFARMLFLMLPKKPPPPPPPLHSGKFIFTKLFCLFYIISTQTIYIYQNFHEMNGFVKLRAVRFKIVYFFNTPCLIITEISYCSSDVI